MAYIKYGITTKIMKIYNNKETDTYINNSFDLNLFAKKSSSYYLKSKLLEDNINDFRKEIISFTDGKGDSLDNTEAYCLNTDIDTLLKNKIVLIDNNERYYFSNNKYFKFDTDQVIVMDNKIGIKLYLIPIFWDVNKVEFENFFSVATFINNIIRSSTTNILKGASFFTVV